MGSEATSRAISCFLKRSVAPAAQRLQASALGMQPSDPEVAQQDSGSSAHLLSRPCPEGLIKSQSESFGYHPGGDVHRCMLCLRQFDSKSSLQSHESLSGLHQSNLENPSSVAQGRERMVRILRSTANELIEDWIASKPMSLAARIECLKDLKSATAD